jgi:hypothetical protein
MLESAGRARVRDITAKLIAVLQYGAIPDMY